MDHAKLVLHLAKHVMDLTQPNNVYLVWITLSINHSMVHVSMSVNATSHAVLVLQILQFAESVERDL